LSLKRLFSFQVKLKSCLDVSRAKAEFNFEAKTELSAGLEKTIDWYRINRGKIL